MIIFDIVGWSVIAWVLWSVCVGFVILSVLYALKNNRSKKDG